MCTSFGEVLNLKVGARRLAGLLGSSVVSFERQIYDVPKCGKKLDGADALRLPW